MVILLNCGDKLFDSYDEAIKLDPKDKEVWNNKGNALDE